MARVESMYRTVLDRNDSMDCGGGGDCCAQQQKEAKEKLAMILLQSGRSHDADELLASLGFTCRLASRIFNYETLLSTQPLLPDATTTMMTGTTTNEEESNALPCCFCKVFDNVLDDDQLQLLQTVFGDITSSYWTDHAYAVEPSPSPYYSYVLPLLPQQLRNRRGDDVTEYDTGGSLYTIVYRLRDILQQHFPTIKNANYVEVWAHNRPHATGHQFHFDSDNEGCTEVIRNPLVSCVVYLSGNNVTAGGPTVVTNQRLSSRQLASKAWLVPATKSNRLIAFDGKLLHGVVPGSGSSSHRRVSLMLAFWKKIRVRQQPGAAACRWPAPGAVKAEWADALMMTPTVAAVAEPAKHIASSGGKQATREMLPIAVSPVYETIPGGQPWSSRLGVPDYELMFQGM
jgi:hypothetical protein